MLIMSLRSIFQPHQPIMNNTVEAIGPLSCTKDGIYLVGGGLSGNAYIWNVCKKTLNYLFFVLFYILFFVVFLKWKNNNILIKKV